jgi:hypothetical protein
MAKLTEYRGGPIETEYILTADLARAFLTCDCEIKIEYLNRSLLGPLVCQDDTLKKKLGSRRTDIAITYSGIIPRSLVKLKIRANHFNRVKCDLDKIIITMSAMKPAIAASGAGPDHQ